MLTAQTITLGSNGESNCNFENVDLNQKFDCHISVTNNTNEVINLKWVREVVDCQTEWKTQICDNIQCYSNIVSSNIDPTIQLDIPYTLNPGETDPDFYVKFSPTGVAGCCTVKVNFSKVENPDSILATATFKMSINQPNCFALSTEEADAVAAIQAYPNPSLGTFALTENPLVRQVRVFNVLGEQVASFQHSNGHTHDISALPDGLYVLGLLNAQGELLKSVRLTRQSVR
jgi:hypothetical protein